eukprot:TRINITY_DN3713_c0_g2_i1.p1 TRINITY_DN3713_c0_g2~~TRINITY_DN3713_c0_g2_i1.p1  ORF type:complete len:279 (-),score=65.58 TRINITY_DN3713_c0_g2_i1:238-1074(-)
MDNKAEAVVLGGAVVGAVGAKTAFLGAVHAVGFGPAGVAADSVASAMMSKFALAAGGNIAKGSMVALAQSVGATGVLGTAATVAVTVTGVGLAAGVAYGAYHYGPDAALYVYRHTPAMPDSVKQTTRVVLDSGSDFGSKAYQEAGKYVPDSVKQGSQTVFDYGSQLGGTAYEQAGKYASSVPHSVKLSTRAVLDSGSDIANTVYDQAGKYASVMPDLMKQSARAALVSGSDIANTVYDQAGSVISARSRSAMNLGRDVGSKIYGNFTGLSGKTPVPKL